MATPSVEQLEQDMAAWVARCEAAMARQTNSSRGKAKNKGKQRPQAPACAERDALLGEVSSLIEEYQLNKGEPLWVPESTVSASAPLPKTWDQYFSLRKLPTKDLPDRCLITDSLTFPLTVIHAIAHFYASDGNVKAGDIARERMTVHVLGAEDGECNGVDKWSELLQLLPAVNKLEVVMVGPELREDLDGVMQVGSIEDVPQPKRKKRKTNKNDKSVGGSEQGQQGQKSSHAREYSITFVRALYHEYAASVAEEDGTAIAPNLVVAFNSGVADYRDDWAPTIAKLLDMDVPCCFTSYHGVEADFDARTLRDVLGANILVCAQENPFKSLLPHEDLVEPEKSFYGNGLITLFRGKGDAQ